jgi:putative SOS response-associated peptidase YedK
MCGRITLKTAPPELSELFREFNLPLGLNLSARFNVAPSQKLVVVPNDGQKTARLMHWGLVPRWSKDGKGAQINARVEGVADKPFFRDAFRKRRCVVLVDGFYEWGPGDQGGKQPWYFGVSDGRPFAIAGLYETWRAPDGTEREGVALLTVEANELVGRVHHRMPVLLPRASFDAWLAPGEADPKALLPLLRPAPAGSMRAWPVSRAVNLPKNDGPALVVPVATEEAKKPAA